MTATQTPRTPTLPRKYVPTEEASLHTGIPVRRLRKLAREGRLRAYRPGGCRRLLFDLTELEAFVRAGEVKVRELAEVG